MSRDSRRHEQYSRSDLDHVSEERVELESLARSTKTEYRARVKTRIVLMAADGAATRGIVGCTIRIVSKCRMVVRGSTSLVLDNLSTHKHKRDIWLASSIDKELVPPDRA